MKFYRKNGVLRLLIYLLVLGQSWPSYVRADICAKAMAEIYENLNGNKIKVGRYPELAVVDRHTQVMLAQMESELSPWQKPFFQRAIAQAASSTHVRGNAKFLGTTESLQLNPYSLEHPMSRIALVHEGQHLVDHYPGTFIVGDLLDFARWNTLKKTETNAFGREYDLMKNLLSDPEFNAEQTLKRNFRIEGQEPKYGLREPIIDEWAIKKDQVRKMAVWFMGLGFSGTIALVLASSPTHMDNSRR